MNSQVKSSYYSPNFIKIESENMTTPRSSRAAAGSLWLGVSTGISAAGWAECTVAGPGRARRHAAQFSERSLTPLIGHARVALSGVLTRLPSTQKYDTQRGGKGHKPLPTPYNAVAHKEGLEGKSLGGDEATVLGACSGLVHCG